MGAWSWCRSSSGSYRSRSAARRARWCWRTEQTTFGRIRFRAAARCSGPRTCRLRRLHRNTLLAGWPRCAARRLIGSSRNPRMSASGTRRLWSRHFSLRKKVRLQRVLTSPGCPRVCWSDLMGYPWLSAFVSRLRTHRRSSSKTLHLCYPTTVGRQSLRNPWNWLGSPLGSTCTM